MAQRIWEPPARRKPLTVAAESRARYLPRYISARSASFQPLMLYMLGRDLSREKGPRHPSGIFHAVVPPEPTPEPNRRISDHVNRNAGIQALWGWDRDSPMGWKESRGRRISSAGDYIGGKWCRTVQERIASRSAVLPCACVVVIDSADY